jgi:DNA-binding NarL/FixJ family response regulator
MLVRLGIEMMLEGLGNYEVVGVAADGPEVISVVASLRPDIALIDIHMPGLSGIEAVTRIKSTTPDLKLVFVSAVDDPEVVIRALSSGADGYILKDMVPQELAFALETVLRGDQYLSPRISQILVERMTQQEPPAPQLTARQVEILRLVAQGVTGKAIARQLAISPKTVEYHRAMIMRRIGVHDVAGLTRYAISVGLVAASSR